MTQKTGASVGAPLKEKTIQKYLPEPATTKTPPYPTGLLKPGKKAWDNLWASGRLLPEEELLAIDYVYAVDELFKKRAEYNKTPHWLEMGANGAIQPHPVVAQLEKARATFIRYHNILILSPEARIKAAIEMENKQDHVLLDYIQRNASRASKRGAE